ncbi:MAG: hypothetical protein IT489_03125 [Gammaproteobacteria bacterium]|nr:hypothetical protein [Gammaproteobacteria bacterium]
MSLGRNIKITMELLPEMVRLARQTHRGEHEVRTAALLSWTGLAGVIGWTPAMLRAVDREMRRTK